MNLTELALFVIGIGLLVGGAEALVRGASRIAAAAGISPLVIGLTVVAFGTGSPELAVSVQSAASGQTEIAVGNIIGSNILNVLLILGLSALVAPLVVARQLVRIDVPVMIAVCFLMLLFALNGVIGRVEGFVFVVCMAGYTGFLVYQSRRKFNESDFDGETIPNKGTSTPVSAWFMNGVLVLGGLAFLILGARWLVDGAVSIAEALNISEQIIGLTVVAVGTSLPEIATSMMASLRGQRDIAVGNIVGSCIFNVLAVLGLASIVVPIGVSDTALNFDIPVMLAAAVACLPIFFTGHIIARWEGALFLAYYIAYTTYLILDSANYENLPVFSAAMLGFVIPITVVTLAVLTYRSLKARRFKTAAF